MQPARPLPHNPGRARRPWGFVVRDPAPEDVGARVDWSAWYLTDEEDMGEGVEQGETIRVFLSSLGELGGEQGWQNVFLSGDNFFAWVREEPLVRVSPDVYLLDDPPPPPRPKMWQTWLPGHRPPRWALEIVSEDWKKDYDDAPLKYAQLGVRELVIFDPEAATGGARRAPRVPLTVYRRDDDGAFVRVYAGPGPVRSVELGAFLVVVRDGAAVRLRLARDPAGKDIVPTADEAKRAAKAATRAAEAAAREAEAATQAAEAAAREAEAATQAAEAAAREAEATAREAEATAREAEEARRAAEQTARDEAERRLGAEERVRALEAELARLRGTKLGRADPAPGLIGGARAARARPRRGGEPTVDSDRRAF